MMFSCNFKFATCKLGRRVLEWEGREKSEPTTTEWHWGTGSHRKCRHPRQCVCRLVWKVSVTDFSRSARSNYPTPEANKPLMHVGNSLRRIGFGAISAEKRAPHCSLYIRKQTSPGCCSSTPQNPRTKDAPRPEKVSAKREIEAHRRASWLRERMPVTPWPCVDKRVGWQNGNYVLVPLACLFFSAAIENHHAPPGVSIRDCISEPRGLQVLWRGSGAAWLFTLCGMEIILTEFDLSPGDVGWAARRQFIKIINYTLRRTRSRECSVNGGSKGYWKTHPGVEWRKKRFAIECTAKTGGWNANANEVKTYSRRLCCVVALSSLDCI